jgi:hypothetical protein
MARPEGEAAPSEEEEEALSVAAAAPSVAAGALSAAVVALSAAAVALSVAVVALSAAVVALSVAAGARRAVVAARCAIALPWRAAPSTPVRVAPPSIAGCALRAPSVASPGSIAATRPGCA